MFALENLGTLYLGHIKLCHNEHSNTLHRFSGPSGMDDHTMFKWVYL